MSSFSHGPMRGLLSDLDNRRGWTLLAGSESMIAGAGAGLISSIVTCPLDVVKTRLQARGGMKLAPAPAGTPAQMEGLVGTLRTIWTHEGIRGLYRGLAPTIYGYLPTWAIYFTVYDRVKARLAEKRGTQANKDPVSHVVAAMTGGATGTVITNPLWVIKTRFMTQAMDPGQHERYRHTYDAIRSIWRDEGPRAFYKGLLPSLFGVAHVAVQFPLYEKLKSLYNADTENLPSQQILVCSSLSKACASVTTYPHEVVRTRLQIQRPSLSASSATSGSASSVKHKQRGVVDTIRMIARDEGFRGFYRGLGVNLIRTVPSSALTILTYELLMRNLNKLTHPPAEEAKTVTTEA